MRWAEYEERRKRNVETVLKDLMTANSRTNYRKTTSVLNRLTMQHDERMLKTAFKQLFVFFVASRDKGKGDDRLARRTLRSHSLRSTRAAPRM